MISLIRSYDIKPELRHDQRGHEYIDNIPCLLDQRTESVWTTSNERMNKPH